MCGITGILNLNHDPVSPTDLQRMADAISHRGPDGEGYWTDRFIGFGHRRLAILDLTDAAHQPMLSDDGRVALIYNGEIYNFRELRNELKDHGYNFRSTGDTEVVLKAYHAWDAKCIKRFNGMFAFAAWDKREQTLFLARDRYGIKPLYYTKQGNTFLFGSEIKAILAHPSYKTNIDKEALLEYFTFQNFFTDKTLFKDIRILPPGCFMQISTESETFPIPTQYWDFHFTESEEKVDEAEYIEELDRLFRQAVKRQLASDLEIGSYLSGGMDTGSITALASEKISRIKTFTIGFDMSSVSGLELGFDERSKAEKMSYLFKTDHYERVLKSGDMEQAFQKLAWHIEEPRVGQSYPQFYASQLAGKFVKVVLSGAGGDELFAGYPWRYYRAVVNDDFEHYIDKYYKFWQRLIPNRSIHEVFRPIWKDVDKTWTRDIFRHVFKEHSDGLYSPEDYINHSLYFEAKTFLHGLLVMEDKLSMAHGLENRVPFLDNDLVDFAMQIPVNLKLGNLGAVVNLNENEPGSKTARYFEKTKDGKLILRKVMERYIPQSVTNREKQGFSGPDASWFKGESIDYVRNIVFNDQSKIYEFLDRTTVHKLVDEHTLGKVNRRLLIWSLLSFENWCEQFL
jgi:asparagine synthase (glutamine-hydrolysing)